MDTLIKSSLSVIALILSVSCSDNLKMDESRRLAFNTEIEGTRSAPVTQMKDYENFRVYGYLYSDTWTSDKEANIMNDETVSYDSKTKTWLTDNTFVDFLNGTNKLRCDGYAPKNVAGLSVTSTKGGLAFDYTVPQNVTEQTDLAVGVSSGEIKKMSDINLSFSHCLSAVTFKMEGQTANGTIKQIKLKNIYSKGSYKVGQGWSNLTDKTNFSILDDIVIEKDKEKNLTSGNNTLMLIPQTVPSDASLEVSVVDEKGNTKTLTTNSIAGNVWPKGNTVEYAISFASLQVKDTIIIDFN